MQIKEDSLHKLDTTYQGYLEGKKLDEFMNEFDIKFAAGHWAAGDFYDRFAIRGYHPTIDSSIVSQVERVAMAGVKGIELMDDLFTDNKRKTNRDQIRQLIDMLKQYDLQPASIGINLYSDPKWKLGGITNASAVIREEAISIAEQAMEIAAAVGCRSVSLWPGSDGWDYNFEVNYGRLQDRFIQGCIAINNKAKSLGISFGIEAKPYEPREGSNVISTSHIAILVSRMVNQQCGGANMGIVVDYGHEQMCGLEPASMLYTARVAAVPVVNFHLNDAKFRSSDEDRIAGTSDIWRLVDFCYAAIDTCYDGWFSLDQFTYRTDPVKSMSLSREFFGNAMKKALLMYASKDKLESAQATGDAIATIEFAKKYLY